MASFIPRVFNEEEAWHVICTSGHLGNNEAHFGANVELTEFSDFFTEETGS